MLYTLRFFLSSKCSLFHNANLFGSCIIHILYTGCAKIKKNNSGAKGLTASVPTGLRRTNQVIPGVKNNKIELGVEAVRHNFVLQLLYCTYYTTCFGFY